MLATAPTSLLWSSSTIYYKYRCKIFSFFTSLPPILPNSSWPDVVDFFLDPTSSTTNSLRHQQLAEWLNGLFLGPNTKVIRRMTYTLHRLHRTIRSRNQGHRLRPLLLSTRKHGASSGRLQRASLKLNTTVLYYRLSQNIYDLEITTTTTRHLRTMISPRCGSSRQLTNVPNSP